MIKKYLFDTNAIQVSNHSQPFWYASNTFGPFFINTHYLFGSESEAKKFLKTIDDNITDKTSAPALYEDIVKKQYECNNIYRSVIDNLVGEIKKSIDIDYIDIISGGERRDWFFSYIIARLLKKPHLTIYKDCSYNILLNGSIIINPDIKGKSVLHISDLVTMASSYINTWIPAIRSSNAVINDTFTIIDRCQGGKEILQNNNVRLKALFNIDRDLFDQALKQSVINHAQYEMIISFTGDPNHFMKEFIEQNPHFIQDSIEKGGKDGERAAAFLTNLNKER